MRITQYAMILMNAWRLVICLLLLVVSKQDSKLRYDLERWRMTVGRQNLSLWMSLCYLLIYYPEYRNLFYHRTREQSKILTALQRILLPPMNTLFITTEKIGPGLFIQHGFATIISASSIGKDCWINQQVTIGYSNDLKCPVIGDRVTICAGAKVIGGVTIGDGSTIGANAVIVKDVPPNCTVVGVPGRIVRRDGVRTDEPL